MAEDSKTVRLYALSTCPVCKRVRRFLDDHGVAYRYIEVDVLEGGEQWLASQEVKKHNPEGSYPTVVVEDVVKGFDEERLRTVLGLG